jgi:hypothetical protein
VFDLGVGRGDPQDGLEVVGDERSHGPPAATARLSDPTRRSDVIGRADRIAEEHDARLTRLGHGAPSDQNDQEVQPNASATAGHMTANHRRIARVTAVIRKIMRRVAGRARPTPVLMASKLATSATHMRRGRGAEPATTAALVAIHLGGVGLVVVDAGAVLSALDADMVRCSDGWTNLREWLLPRAVVSIVAVCIVVGGGVCVIAEAPDRRSTAVLAMLRRSR